MTRPAAAILLALIASHAPAQPPNKVVLADGKFGKALDARSSPLLLPNDARFRQPPLTVECWAKLRGKSGFNVLVASDSKASSLHWEVYTYAGGGDLSAYLPGMNPSEIRSGVDVCDGRWHHLAMLHDGKEVRLVIDGKEAVRRAVTPREGLKPRPGPLTVGTVVYGARDELRVGCDGLIDEVRISRGLRRIDAAPVEAPAEDGKTLGVWRFDRPDGLPVDPAWTPPVQVGNVPWWWKTTDKDWVDARFRLMDTGPFLNATIDYAGPQARGRAHRGTAIKVGDRGEATVLFDRGQLRLAAAWTGGFLRHSDRRFGLLNTPAPDGSPVFATHPGAGWAGAGGAWAEGDAGTAPLPRAWGRYRGLYLHGKRVVLSYTVGETEVLESPWAETFDGGTAISRTIEVGAAKRPLRVLLCELPGGSASLEAVGKYPAATARAGDAAATVALADGGESPAKLEVIDRSRVELVIPPRDGPARLRVLYWHGKEGQRAAFAGLLAQGGIAPDLRDWARPGPARWGRPLVTRGERGKDDGPFAVDTLTVPHDNPYKALLFLGGLDFLGKDHVAVCSAHGDVWLVGGADEGLRRVTWKRFATGLYQPLGLRTVGGKVHVLERGQITRLHDGDGDGEADFYENVASDWHLGGGEHSYDTCLETDAKGNFYFFKTGDAQTPTGGCLLRVSPDGSKVDVYATGFRHPTGMGISPDGVLSGADQEGNWMPATRLDLYREGGFYGDMRTHHRKAAPKTYDPPLCWLPREMDNSAGGQVWVPPGTFGPLGGQMLHLSYGRCRALLVLRQEADGVRQGGATDLGLQFLSGVMRARFSPHDGHLYLAGLKGWQTAAVQDGCLQRVRRTGKPVNLPASLAVHADGIRLGFTCPLDRKAAEDPKNYRVRQWNYRWSEDYGSKRWSPAAADRQGMDEVGVKSATLLPDGKGVFLRTATLGPVMQMEIDYRLAAESGAPLAGVIDNTVHRAAPAFLKE